MKRLTTLLISSVFLFGAVACTNNVSKTSGSAPENASNETVQTPSQDIVKEDLKDAQSEVRRDQLNADIRAREQRNNLANEGSAVERDASDMASEVRSKLEANIPNGQLTVKATKDGAVTVSGTVPNQDQYNKIDPLARQIKGVKSVTVNAVVASPTREK